MKTFWCRLLMPATTTEKMKWVDHFVTGFSCEGGEAEKETVCFAVRAINEEEVTILLKERLSGLSYDIDSIIEKPWVKYGDFAGDNTRFPMQAKYLDEKIDSIEMLRRRA